MNLLSPICIQGAGQAETTFLKRNLGFKSPVTKWKRQASQSLIGRMMIFIMDPRVERLVREPMLQWSPGGLTTDYCNRLKVT